MRSPWGNPFFDDMSVEGSQGGLLLVVNSYGQGVQGLAPLPFADEGIVDYVKTFCGHLSFRYCRIASDCTKETFNTHLSKFISQWPQRYSDEVSKYFMVFAFVGHAGGDCLYMNNGEQIRFYSDVVDHFARYLPNVLKIFIIEGCRKANADLKVPEHSNCVFLFSTLPFCIAFWGCDHGRYAIASYLLNEELRTNTGTLEVVVTTVNEKMRQLYNSDQAFQYIVNNVPPVILFRRQKSVEITDELKEMLEVYTRNMEAFRQEHPEIVREHCKQRGQLEYTFEGPSISKERDQNLGLRHRKIYSSLVMTQDDICEKKDKKKESRKFKVSSWQCYSGFLCVIVLAVLIAACIWWCYPSCDDKVLKDYTSLLRSIYQRKTPIEGDPRLSYVPVELGTMDPNYCVKVAESKHYKQSIKDAEQVFVENMFKANTELLPSDEYLKPINQSIKSISSILLDDVNSVIALIGAPGIGKTTLLHHVLHSLGLDNSTLHLKYDLILYFPLRAKRVQNANDLIELLQYYQGNIDYKCLYKKLLNNLGDRVLFLFDGLDEAGSLLRRETSYFNELLQGHLLSNSTVVVTTRPVVYQHLCRYTNNFYAIQGFSELQIYKYAEQYFSYDSHLSVENFIKELESKHDLYAAAYIPVNLLVFCQVFSHNKGSLLPTITANYKEFFLHLLSKHIEKRDNLVVSWPVNADFRDLPQKELVFINKLSKLSFNGVKDPTNRYYVFEKEMVKEIFELEDMETFDGKGFFDVQLVDTSKYSLKHPTLQEFLGAYYLTCLDEFKQVEFWSTNVNFPAMAMVFRFYCGLSGIRSYEMQKVLLAKFKALPNKIKDSYTLMVLLALHESDNDKLTKEIVQSLSSNIQFDLILGPYELLIISHCLSKCFHLKELHFSGQIESSWLLQISKIAKSNTALRSLGLNMKSLEESHAKALFQSTGSLEELTIWIQYDISVSALVSIFSLKQLTNLSIDITGQLESTPQDEQAFNESVEKNKKLKHLELLHSAIASVILKALFFSSSLESLTLYSPDHLKREHLEFCLNISNLTYLELKLADPLPLLEALSLSRKTFRNVTIMLPQWPKALDSETESQKLKGLCSEVNVEHLSLDVEHDWRNTVKINLITFKIATAVIHGFSQNKRLKKLILKNVPVTLKDFTERELGSRSFTYKVYSDETPNVVYYA